jgi:hypothetical protein
MDVGGESQNIAGMQGKEVSFRATVVLGLV